MESRLTYTFLWCRDQNSKETEKERTVVKEGTIFLNYLKAVQIEDNDILFYLLSEGYDDRTLDTPIFSDNSF